jgi:transcriptional regulator with XRE-family HTH domain
MPPKAKRPFAMKASIHAPNPIDCHVGGRVRMLRLLSGVDLDAFARRIGVTAFEMQNYELGQSRISAEHLRRICGVLNTPPSFFFESGPVIGAAKALRVRVTTLNTSGPSLRQ